MKRFRTGLAVLLALASVCLVLSGCADKLLYGQWNLVGTELQDGSNLEPYPISVTLELKRDGSAYMYDTLFGTLKRNGYRFELTTLSTGEVITGTWTLVDTYLLVYPDNSEMVYRFQAVNRS